MFRDLIISDESLDELNPFKENIHFLKNLDRFGALIGFSCWVIGITIAYVNGQFGTAEPYVSTLQNIEPQYTIIAFGTTFMGILLYVSHFYVISHRVALKPFRHFFHIVAFLSLGGIILEAIVPIDKSANELLYTEDGREEFYSNLSDYSRIHIYAMRAFLVGSFIHWAVFTLYSLFNRSLRRNFQIRLLMIPVALLLGEAAGWSIDRVKDDEFSIESAKSAVNEYIMLLFSMIYWVSFDLEARHITLWVIDAKKAGEGV